jgi:hypothetical protein
MIGSFLSFLFSSGKSLEAAHSAKALEAVSPVERMAPRVSQDLSCLKLQNFVYIYKLVDHLTEEDL